MEKKRHCTAILLAGGKGTRMGANVSKQFLLIAGKPILYYSLMAIEQSAIIDDCVLVIGASDEAYLRTEILDKYSFTKVKEVTLGGAERYHSVQNGLQCVRKLQEAEREDGFVFVMDGARPFLTEDILQRCLEGVDIYGACVAAVPSKDTIKLADEDGIVMQTPPRKSVWNMQTPQTFATGTLCKAFEILERENRLEGITDDAEVVERAGLGPIKLVMGDYRNVKVTTPEDLDVMEGFLKQLEIK